MTTTKPILLTVDDDPDEQLLARALQERHNIDVAQAFRTVTYFDDPLDAQYTAYDLGPFHYRDEIQASGVPFYVQVGWLDAGTVIHSSRSTRHIR